MCDARKCSRYRSHGINCPWSNTEFKDIYTYNTYIKYRDKISVINRQSQMTTFTSNQPTYALTLGVHYDCFCQFLLGTFDLSGVIYVHFKSTGTEIPSIKTENRFNQFE